MLFTYNEGSAQNKTLGWVGATSNKLGFPKKKTALEYSSESSECHCLSRLEMLMLLQ